jgi:kinetochore protein Nuf2
MNLSFPILTATEIVQCMNEIDIELTEQALAKPTYQIVRPVYTQLVEKVLHIRKEDLEQFVFSALDVLEHPELHEESIPELAFNRAVKKLMAVVQVPNFHISDVYKPDFKKTVRNLSAVINFIKFRSERIRTLSQFHKEEDELIEQQAHAEEQQRGLQASLQALRNQLAAEEPQVQQLTQETQELEMQLGKSNKIQYQLQGDIRVIRQRVSELTDSVKNKKFIIVAAKQERQRLKAQVIQSPEKLRKSITDLEEGVENEKKALNATEAKARELRARLDCLEKIEKEVLQSVTAMEECGTEIEKVKQQKTTIHVIQERIVDRQAHSRELESKEGQIKRQVQATLDKQARFEEQQAAKQDAAKTSLEEVQRERGHAQKENEEIQAKIEQNEERIKRVQKKIAERRREHKEQLDILNEKFDQLEAQVHEYHHHLLRAMRNV